MLWNYQKSLGVLGDLLARKLFFNGAESFTLFSRALNFFMNFCFASLYSTYNNNVMMGTENFQQYCMSVNRPLKYMEYVRPKLI